ncbi:MAG: mercury methylation corrinoid protein HgcA [Syntrophales bacterium]
MKKTPVMLPMASEDCCSVMAEAEICLPGLDQPFVTSSVSTPVGLLPRVSAKLLRKDHWGTIRARWGIGRMNYTVEPGLYALGYPDNRSPVLVSANYKMSFDELRKTLPDRDAWVLVLDTKGINVWCAAGKGTFGTEELVSRIASSGLEKIVSHKEVILPQLGAPGVAAHMVRKLSGFNVRYGPVLARDIGRYLDTGKKATAAMRHKTFTLAERSVLIPIEFIEAMKAFLVIAPILFLLGSVGGPGGFWPNALHSGSFSVLAFFSAFLTGSVFHPILLPYLPGRAFSVKGFWLGLAAALLLVYFGGYDMNMWPGRMAALAWLLIIPAVSAYLAMNFTGCSTYTSLSGVKKEMRWALPVEITAGASGLLMWVASRLVT